MKTYYEQMTTEVECAVKTMSAKELRSNIVNCENLLIAGGIDDADRSQIEKERLIYERELDARLGIFPGSGHGIQKPN